MSTTACKENKIEIISTFDETTKTFQELMEEILNLQLNQTC